MIRSLVRFISAKICLPRLFSSRLGSLIPCWTILLRRPPGRGGPPKGATRGMRCSKRERRNLSYDSRMNTQRGLINLSNWWLNQGKHRGSWWLISISNGTIKTSEPLGFYSDEWEFTKPEEIQCYIFQRNFLISLNQNIFQYYIELYSTKLCWTEWYSIKH